MKKSQIARKIILIVVIINFLITSYYYLEQHDNLKIVQKDAITQIEQLDNIEQIQISQKKIEKLQENYHNPDIKAVLSIESISQFSYPVAQTTNNEYYLNHNYRKEEDNLGAIYTDYRIDLETSQKILIYGHSSTKRELPFNQLENYYDEEYYQNHKYITLETKSDIYRYEIFSVYVETSDFTYMNINFESQEEWYSHILKLQNKSLYQTDVKLTQDDDILIIQTCSNHSKYQKYKSKYLLIVSRRV